MDEADIDRQINALTSTCVEIFVSTEDNKRFFQTNAEKVARLSTIISHNDGINK